MTIEHLLYIALGFVLGALTVLMVCLHITLKKVSNCLQSILDLLAAGKEKTQQQGGAGR